MSHLNIPKFPDSYWRESVELPSFPKLEETITVDVGIVGAGITGITAAYLLSKENLSVALLDAGVILDGTTGHTTAKVTAQHGLIYDEFIQHFGEEKARLYYEANIGAKQFIEQTIQELQIDCDFEQEDAFIYTNSDDYIQKLKTEQKAYETLNIEHELVDIMPLNVPHKLALNMKNQIQFHPLKYLKRLIEECENQSVQFFENTTAINVEYNKQPAIVTRDHQRVICKYVIQASHYPFFDGQGFYPTRMYADRSYILAAKSDLQYPGGMYITAETPTRSIRKTMMDGEDLWLIGGESHKTGQGDSTITYYEALQYFATQHFSISEFLYRWSAQDLVTLDKMPYIGRVTEKQDNVFVATGYRKWGMTNGTAAAKLICNLIVEKECRYEDVFTPSRFQADPAIKKFMSYNLDVAKHLIKGKLEYTDANLDDLKKGEANIVRINGKRTGAFRDEENNLHLVDTTCTHLGCEVDWNKAEQSWDCPCHGSRFTHTGEVIEGPAVEPLKRIEP